MKKIKNIFIVFMLSLLNIVALNNSAKAQDLGLAVVDPSTGKVYGVIVASNTDPFNTGGILPGEFMGCTDCKLVPQTTADSNGNVAGKRSQENVDVVYNSNRNIFEVTESNSIENRRIIESESNTSSVETEVLVLQSKRNYEFGFQNFKENRGEWQITETTPFQNTSVQISATTKEFMCEESGIICSQRLSNSSTTLNEEIASFSERKTSEQVNEQLLVEAKTKIRQQLNLILTMLQRWIID
jgi:hypothetical protein